MDNSAENGDVEGELIHLINAIQGTSSTCTIQEIMSAENEPVRGVTYVHSCLTSCGGGPGVISVIVAGGTASVM